MATETYEVFTLFDITYTGTKRNYNARIIPFVDQAHRKIVCADTWQKSRNQQRNWDTVIQLLGLRNQPVSFTLPIVAMEDLANFKFGPKYIGKANVWKFTCEYEHADLYRVGDNVFKILEDDFRNVPMITGLSESVTIHPSCFQILPECNIYFKKMKF